MNLKALESFLKGTGVIPANAKLSTCGNGRDTFVLNGYVTISLPNETQRCFAPTQKGTLRDDDDIERLLFHYDNQVQAVFPLEDLSCSGGDLSASAKNTDPVKMFRILEDLGVVNIGTTDTVRGTISQDSLAILRLSFLVARNCALLLNTNQAVFLWKGEDLTLFSREQFEVGTCKYSVSSIVAYHPVPDRLEEVRRLVKQEYISLCEFLSVDPATLDIYFSFDYSSYATIHGTPLNRICASYQNTGSPIVAIPLDAGDADGVITLGSFPPNPKTALWPAWRMNLWHEVCHQFSDKLGIYDPHETPTGDIYSQGLGKGHGVGWRQAVKEVETKLGCPGDTLIHKL